MLIDSLSSLLTSHYCKLQPSELFIASCRHSCSFSLPRCSGSRSVLKHRCAIGSLLVSGELSGTSKKSYSVCYPGECASVWSQTW